MAANNNQPNIQSKRHYKVAICDQIGLSVEKITLNRLMDDSQDLELFYALRDLIDEVLDLKVDESIYFQPNRDDKNTKGIIRRVQ